MLNLGLILSAVIKLTELFEQLNKRVEMQRRQQEKELLDKALQMSKLNQSTEQLSREIGKLL